MVERSAAKRVRDFGCGDLLTVASGGDVSLHYYVRGDSHARPDVEHVYPSHSLVFTEVGEWRYHGTERESQIDRGVVVAGTGARHYACSHPHGLPNECFVVAIRDDAFGEEGERLFARSTVRATPEMLVHRRAIAGAADDRTRLESLAFSLYDLVARGADGREYPRFDVRMRYAERLMAERFMHPTTVAAVAREVSLSRFAFSRRFLAHAGITPHAYLTGLRIDRAKEQLRRTRASIEEIALANGFGSIAHFSNAFRRIAGCSPTTYRLANTR